MIASESHLPDLSNEEEKDTTKKDPIQICQECQKTTFKYQCPRCSWRTCSLACCVGHKKRLNCNGKRDRTKFMTVSKMNDSTLASDYHFLEDVLLSVERAKRTVGGNISGNGSKRPKHHHASADGENASSAKDIPHSMLQQLDLGEAASPGNTSSNTTANNSGQLPPNNPQNLPPKWRHFLKQAGLRGINVLLMPAGMQRRKANSSHVKKDAMYWKLDVRIHSTGEPCTSTIKSMKLSEQIPLIPEIKKIVLKDDKNNFNDSKKTSTKYHWLIQKLPSPSNRPCYFELKNETANLQGILKGMTIIEYPTIEAVPAGRLGDFPCAIEEVEKKVNSSSMEISSDAQATAADVPSKSTSA